MTQPLILVEDISYHYLGHKSSAYAQVSFSLNGGELMCLAGVNGSGKTTLLYTLAGLYAPTTGTITLHGQSNNMAGDENSLRRSTALVVQEASLQIMGSTVAEDLELTIKTEVSPDKPRGKLEEQAHAILSFFHLEHKTARPVQALSYGEKKKLCLATAFLREPEILLLDEPFSGLDYPACLEVLAYAKLLLTKGTAIIMSTHDTDLIFSFTDKFLFLSPELPPFWGTRADASEQYAQYKLKPLAHMPWK